VGEIELFCSRACAEHEQRELTAITRQLLPESQIVTTVEPATAAAEPGASAYT
jgi:hypothetical protein